MALNEFQFAEAFATVSLRDREFHAAMGRITGSLTKLKASLDAAARQAQRFLLIGAGALAAFVKVAADAEESASRFNAVFKEGAPDVRKWADELASAVGRSRQEIETSLASFQAFFIGLGFGVTEAESMSKKMQALSIDFASFNNLADADATQRFISALSGSSEVLNIFGINIKASALDLELLRMGISKSTAQASEQERAIARLNVIYKAMGDQGAIGDAIRTSGSMANQFKRLVSDVKALAISLGQTFMPIAKDLVTWLVSIVKVSKEWVVQNRELIVTMTKYGAIGLAAVIISSKLATAVVALSKALQLAATAQAFLFGVSGPAAWAAMAAGVAAATAAVLAMGVAYDKVADSAGKVVNAAKEASAAAEKSAVASEVAVGGPAGGGGLASKTKVSDAVKGARTDLAAATAAIATAEAGVATAQRAAAESEKRIEENRAKAQAARERKLAGMRAALGRLPGPREKIETPLGDINLGVGALFGTSDEDRLAAIDAASKALTEEGRKPLPGVSRETQDLIRSRRQADVAAARQGVATARVSQGAARQRLFAREAEDRKFAQDMARIRGGLAEPLVGEQRPAEFPHVIRQQQAFQQILQDRNKLPRGRDGAEQFTTSISALNAALQQRLNQKPTQGEQEIAKKLKTMIGLTEKQIETIEKINLGWQ